MNKKFLFSLILFISFFSFLAFSIYNTKASEKSTVLFYGEGCPHCITVSEYIKENPNLEKELEVIKKEIYNNKENKVLFKDAAKKCNIESYGVPLLFDGKNCYVGSFDIIEFFQTK